MNAKTYYPPKFAMKQFNCPSCGVFAAQYWNFLYACDNSAVRSKIDECQKFVNYLPQEWTISKCQHCGAYIFWKGENIAFPKIMTVRSPNSDLSPDIQSDYIEAARILNDSPRASAAILRLALQKLCRQLGEKGDNINEDIKSLVAKGLNPLVQKSLDALRITGNNAVHPGDINLNEESDRVLKLFELINFIASKLITEPKEIEAFYDQLPENSKDAVKKRDGVQK